MSEYVSELLQMGFHCVPKDDYIVHVEHWDLPLQSSENLLHQTLERGWCVAQTKRHGEEPVQATTTISECRLVPVFRSHLHLPKAREQVQCRIEQIVLPVECPDCLLYEAVDTHACMTVMSFRR